MKFFALFIYRPVATILISLAITLCGILGFRLLPVAPVSYTHLDVYKRQTPASLKSPSPRRRVSWRKIRPPLPMPAAISLVTSSW